MDGYQLYSEIKRALENNKATFPSNAHYDQFINELARILNI